jgi:hypothetical protein
MTKNLKKFTALKIKNQIWIPNPDPDPNDPTESASNSDPHATLD